MSSHKRFDMDALQHDPEAVLSNMSADTIGDLLQHASDAYYIKGKPIISDDLYDLIFDYLKKKHPKHPATQRIGAPIQPGKKEKLPYWMGSLDKIRDDPKALTRWLSDYSDPESYVVSDKLDGNSGLLVYDAKGMSLYSRGDGTYGQNVSHLLTRINGIVPMNQLSGKDGFLLPFAVRGELIIPKKGWEQIKELGANARNVVAGAMHASAPDKRITDRIDFVAYELLEPRMPPMEGMELLKSLGFMVAYYAPLTKQGMTMDKLSDILVARRRDSPYEVDGIVLTHNREHKRIKGKNPKYSFAFKSLLTHDEAEVIVSRVEWNVSKDGYIKPLVHFPTVVIEGARISKATGFNAAFIEQHRIGPGSRIVVIRSGAVIPHILRVVSPSSNGKPAFPQVPYRWTETHVDIMIEKGEAESPDVMMKRMEYLVNTLDIKNVGPGTIKKLYAAGFDTLPKLLAIKKEDIVKIEGFKSTSAQNIVDGLASVGSARCPDLMAASGAFGRGIGAKKLAPVLERFPRIVDQDAPIPTYEELTSIQGMGDASARSILDGIIPFRRFLREIGHPCKPMPAVPVAGMSQPGSSSPAAAPVISMKGMTFVFTGFRSKEWELAITDAGGKVSTSVSKNTTAVVAVDVNEDSSKLNRAREIGVPILSKDAFAKKHNL